MLLVPFLALFALVQPLQAASGSVRSAARPLADQAPLDPAVVAEAIHKLEAIGIISDAPYWIAAAKPGTFVPTGPLHGVLIAAANKYEPVDTVEAAIVVLHKNKILSNSEKWTNDLVYKPKAASGVVTLLLLALAKNIN